jgi:hypothetical protein
MTTKAEKNSKFAETRENGTTIFFRTGKGSHRHASRFCANSKRDLFTGDVTEIPEAEAATWAACADCCTDADVTEGRKAAEAKADAQCRNSGVTRSGRIYSTCRDCGKEGKVNRSTGKIRAHVAA